MFIYQREKGQRGLGRAQFTEGLVGQAMHLPTALWHRRALEQLQTGEGLDLSPRSLGSAQRLIFRTSPGACYKPTTRGNLCVHSCGSSPHSRLTPWPESPGPKCTSSAQITGKLSFEIYFYYCVHLEPKHVALFGKSLCRYN